MKKQMGASEAQAQRSVESQAADLRDARADAVDNMNKAQATLNALTVTSTADGTVVEVKPRCFKINNWCHSNLGSYRQQW